MIGSILRVLTRDGIATCGELATGAALVALVVVAGLGWWVAMP